MTAIRYLLAALLMAQCIAWAQGERRLHPGFPVVEGPYQMTKDWALVLPRPFNRRIEDGQLVLWRPGHTIWVAAWGDERRLSPAEQLKSIRSTISREAFDIEEESDTSTARLGYRLIERRGKATVYAHYSFVTGQAGYIQMAQYLDDEGDLSAAKTIWRSISRAKP